MHQAVGIKLQGKAFCGRKNKPMVDCRLCACMLCMFSNGCVSERLEKERGGKGESKTKRRKRKGGGSHSSQRGMGMERKRLTGPARTHHPNQLESLISPSNNTSPYISDVYICWERDARKHQCNSDGIQQKRETRILCLKFILPFLLPPRAFVAGLCATICLRTQIS